MKERKLTIMVSSPVYGYQEFLDRIYDLLVGMGYEVWMSHKGTIPVDSTRDTMDCCLEAVAKCDIFLGIITGQYGTTKRGGLSATHLEFRKAIELDKLRWFIVDDRVIFARDLLRRLYADKRKRERLKRSELNFKGDGFNQFSDLRLIDMYEEACNLRADEGVPRVNWVQAYQDEPSALLFATSQFSRYLEIEALLKKRLQDVEAVRTRVDGTGGVDHE